MPRDLRAWLFDAIEAGERVQRFTRSKTYADYQGTICSAPVWSASSKSLARH